MAQAIVIRELGGPEVLKYEGVSLDPPAPARRRSARWRSG